MKEHWVGSDENIASLIFGQLLFLIFHCFHCNDSAFLWVLLLTHIEFGSNLAESHSFTVVLVHAERNRQHYYFT